MGADTSRVMIFWREEIDDEFGCEQKGYGLKR